jgi:hypothetical protein
MLLPWCSDGVLMPISCTQHDMIPPCLRHVQPDGTAMHKQMKHKQMKHTTNTPSQTCTAHTGMHCTVTNTVL